MAGDLRLYVLPGPIARRKDLVSGALEPEVQVVDGDMTAEDLSRLKQWVAMNLHVLVRYWNRDIDTHEALAALHSL